MPDIFNAQIAQQISDALGPLVFDQTLVKIVAARDETTPTRVTNVRTYYSCKGFIDDFVESTFSGTTIKVGDKKIIILGASLESGIVPEPNDEIIAEGITYTIAEKGVERDPAGATYECQAR